MVSTMTTTGRGVRLISWNTKGMNKATKIGKVMVQLQHLNGDIIFLQETHLKTSDTLCIKKAWMSHLFHSKFSQRARGVAIIIRKNVRFELTTSLLDPNGRYVIVSGRLQNTPVILASIYAPNWDDDQFLVNLFAQIPNADDHHIIMAGDWNLVQDVSLDRSSHTQSTLSKSAKVVSHYSSQLGLSDPWRFINPQSKAFSFFSHRHHTFSRIDFFLLDNNLLHLVNSCEYHPIVISDHAPTTLDINFPLAVFPPPTWKFSSHLLSDSDFRDFISVQISSYIEINDTSDVGSGTLWEALKATVRGQIISYVSHMRRAEKARLIEISDELCVLDETYSSSPSPSLYNKRLLLHSEHDLLMTGIVERQLRQCRQHFFEQGDKAGRLLAQQARATSASRLIPQIRSPDGNLTSNPADINRSFLEFYANLYTSECPSIPTPTTNPLNFLTYPKIDDTISRGMGGPISILEIREAIKSMQNGKSPGPDGYTVEFYKAYSSQLAPILAKMYNDSLQEGRLPETLSMASIALLLKKDKDPTSCSSYRPISLLNVDCKILAKILALRLQRVLPEIISPDQTGFMVGRHSFFSTRRLLNIIFSPSSDTPEIIVTLDAEKAFDRVEWGYLFFVLEKFGFDSQFIAWIKLLYASPSASVHTNGIRSPPFSLQRGTRQGCPLSPLLFIIAIEPLAIWLRSHDEFEGITRNSMVHKLSLYADDLLLMVSNPISSLPPILSILDQFGHISGYKLNIQKSEVFFVNELAKALPQPSFPFKRATEGFKYLGVFVTNSFKDLFPKNFQPLVDKCRADMSRWTSLPLSLAGRVNLIKMVILPKFLYLFQHIPVCLNKSFFTELDQLLNAFIWHNKPARIRRSCLQLPKSKGGLAVPNFRHYFWASNINKLLYWAKCKLSDPCPPWVQTELSTSASLYSIICSQLPMAAQKFSSNPVVASTINIWLQFRKQNGLHRASIHTPILNNHLFSPSCTDSAFRVWSNSGLVTFDDLYEDGIFSSFASLSVKFNLPNSHLFRFFQIRHLIQKQFPHFPNRPPESAIDIFLTLDPNQKRLISVLYDQIGSLSPDPMVPLKELWEGDLNSNISDNQWSDILDLVHTSSICARHGLLQCKVLHRAHFTNAKLAKIFPDRSDACNRCNQSPADHLHMFWTCPKLHTFWSDIFGTIEQAFSTKIDPNPLTALFGLPSSDMPSPIRRVIAFATLLARRSILLKWKHTSPPTHDQWIQNVLQCLQLEKLRFSLKGSLKSFRTTWEPLMVHIKELTSTPDTDDVS